MTGGWIFTGLKYIHGMKKWLLLILLLPLWGHSQKLSDNAEIRVVTCGPYQGELYSAFGHSAIRVVDPQSDIDYIYNYGVFNFNQPNFYLNFARGHLKYRLAVSHYNGFVKSYIEEDRFVHEQILNLDRSQTQRFFDFLQWNARPENMHYYYDYFYDNCATRIRDAIKEVMGDTVEFDGSYIQTDYTIRDLCDIYLKQQPWGDLGIDLCLGMPMDKKATSWMYMFLPDYLESGFDHAYIISATGQKPLVKETVVVFEPGPDNAPFIWNTPTLWFSLVLFTGIVITYVEYKKKKHYKLLDVVLFTVTGLLGWLFMLLWFATDHRAAANNLNVLWAFPLHFPLALLLLREKPVAVLSRYFRFVWILQVIVLLGWPFFPQDLNHSLLPLMILLGFRAFVISRSLTIKQISATLYRSGN